MRLRSILGLIVLLISVSCTKKETIREVIPNNQYVPDTLVSNLKIETYINKAYINILGRKATTIETESAKTLLASHNMHPADRESFIKSFFQKKDYWTRTFDIARANYLKNADTSDVSLQIFLFEKYIKDNQNNPQLKDFLYLVQYEIDRMKVFMRTPQELASGKINVTELQRRCTDNYFYDQINMGTQNFVLSVFENFAGRYPTQNERANAEGMVNGVATILFLKNGSSKKDFQEIFFSSKDYYEGQVNELMRRYLFRNATSTEMERLTRLFEQTKDYQKLQTAILTTDEYAGI
jgi:hypothetical protein